MRTLSYRQESLNDGPRSLAVLADYHGSPSRPGFGDGKLAPQELDTFLRDGKFTPHPAGMDLVTYDQRVVDSAVRNAKEPNDSGAQYALARAADLRAAMSVSAGKHAAKERFKLARAIATFPANFMKLLAALAHFLGRWR